MRIPLTLIIFVLGIQSYGQTFIFEVWYRKANEKMVVAKQNNIKSIRIHSYKNQNDKTGKLCFQEDYDTNGRILKTINHHYINPRHFETIYYWYDGVGRLIQMDSKTNFSNNYYYQTKIGYQNNDTINYIMSDFGTDGTFIFDTLYYFFNSNRTINFRYFSSRKDTIYHLYDTYGEFIKTTSKLSDTTDFRILDNNRCIIGFTDTIDTRIRITRDQMCNIIAYSEDHKTSGGWYRTLDYTYKYDGDKLIEEKFYNCYQRNSGICGGELKLYRFRKYFYDNQGNLIQEIDYDRKDRIIEIKKYSYETF